MFIYNKLLGRIKEKYSSNKNLAEKIGISERTLSLKLNSKIDFKQSEIEKICELLEIPDEEISSYFFTKEVH